MELASYVLNSRVAVRQWQMCPETCTLVLRFTIQLMLAHPEQCVLECLRECVGKK